jgi:HK97 family phage major capsid protein/HK97 family phage prohead protease
MNQNQEPIQEPQEPQEPIQEPQQTDDTPSRLVRGYGVLFNHESRDLGGFTEIISPEAIDMALVDNSDIKVYLDHNRDRGILARRNKGNGSLSVSIDEKGVVYEFDAPNTALGDEVLEGLNRGDYNESSFAFTVKRDHWEKVSDGMYKRTILEIEQLYDFSIVADGAYSDTYVSVAKRSLCDYLKEEYRNADEATLQTAIESRSLPTEVKDFCEDKLEELRKAAQTNNDNNKKQIMAETKFSLLKAINDVANNRPLDERAIEVINEGRTEMRKAGQNYSGQIVMPIEQRAGIVQAGVDNLGGVTVQEDKLNVLEALRAKSVLAQAGATFMTGLVGNFSVPVYSGSTVTWEGEVNPAKDGSGVFSEVKFAPKRITAYIDISKQFLLQDSTAAEEMLRRDIVNAVTEKLEKTILGAEAGTATQPAGLFNGASALTVNYAGVVGLEQVLEDANVGGNKKFIVSPAIKAKLKTTAIDAGSGRFLMEGNECNGYEVMSTSACSGLVFGNFEELVVAQWGAFDLTVDSFTQATNGAVRLVINAYFDVKPRRAEAFAARTVK